MGWNVMNVEERCWTSRDIKKFCTRDYLERHLAKVEKNNMVTGGSKKHIIRPKPLVEVTQRNQNWRTEKQSHSLNWWFQEGLALSHHWNQEWNYGGKEGHHQPHSWSQVWSSERKVWLGEWNKGQQVGPCQEISQPYC